MNPNAELARRKHLDFVKYVRPFYRANWHHELLCNYLDKWIAGDIKRLMVFMPPQHGKSELVSRTLPAHVLGKIPTAKIVLSSYSATLAGSFNLDCQRIIDSQLYHEVYPKTILNRSNIVTVQNGWIRNREVFETVGYGGFLKTTGVGGPLTGTTADYAIIDDPVKDSLEAMSATYQIRNWDWFNDVLYTRIHNDTRILITQTRWNVNDLSGLLLKKMENLDSERWTVLCLPAIRIDNATKEDPRQLGEALWPERHNLEKLNQVRRQNVRTFESLYQQNPKPTQAGGEYLDEFRSTHVRPVTYDPTLPVHVSMDNNTLPYIAITVWQILRIPDCYVVRQIKELPASEPENSASKAGKKIVKYLNEIKTNETVWIYGDYSTKNASTIDDNARSFFQIVNEQIINGGYRTKDMMLPHASPSSIGDFINAILKGEITGIRIEIGEHNLISINDYNDTKKDKNGGILKVVAKDPATGASYQPFGHLTDTFKDFIVQAFRDEYIAFVNRHAKLLPGGISQPRRGHDNITF